jgi:hypothetical protein
MNSLFLIAGNSSISPRKSSGNSTPIPLGPSNSGKFPCIFPVYQGSALRDEFGQDSPHRHPGSGCRDFPPGSQDGSGKAREFAGCWRLRSIDSEAETGLFRGDSRRLARSSLSAISVVRFDPPDSYGPNRNPTSRDSTPEATRRDGTGPSNRHRPWSRPRQRGDY